MKFSSMSALALAAAATTMAAPNPQTGALKPLELTKVSASIPFTTMPQTTLFGFSLKDPNTNTETECSSYWWVLHQPPTSPNIYSNKDTSKVEFHRANFNSGQSAKLETSPTIVPITRTSSSSPMVFITLRSLTSVLLGLMALRVDGRLWRVSRGSVRRGLRSLWRVVSGMVFSILMLRSRNDLDGMFGCC